MSWDLGDIPDLSGRTAVVTGANSGLGLEVARALAGARAHVVMAVRNRAKADRARDAILRAVPGARLEVVELDLASLASVRTAAAHIVSAHDRIDVLVNNAGVMAVPERRTPDGFEMQLGVNHLGHWALTSHLLPALADTPGTRVVSVTSTGHHLGRALDPDNPHQVGRYGPWRAYGHAKLANYHFGIGLQREFDRVGALAGSLVAHPGLSKTELQATSVKESGGAVGSRIWYLLAATTGMSPRRAALPLLRAATDPAARGGELYAPRFINNGPPVRRPILRRVGLDRAIETLWRVSERETGLRIDVEAIGSGTA